MLNQPLVSVLMTAYNRERFIGEAIESVLNSSYQNIELIIVDDGSVDDTVNIARRYAAGDSRVRIYINDKNLGDYPNRNKAAGYAGGKYIMYCDSDDTLKDLGIEFCVDAMERFPEAGFGIYWAYEDTEPFLRSIADSAKKNFFGEPFLGMGPGGTILKKSFFESMGKYPTKYGPANDMYFNIKAICHTPVVLLPRQFMNYRIHENQERNNTLSYLLNNYLYLNDALNEQPLPLKKSEINWLKKKNKRRFLVNMIRFLFKTGNLKQTLSTLKKSRFGIADTFSAVLQLS